MAKRGIGVMNEIARIMTQRPQYNDGGRGVRGLEQTQQDASNTADAVKSEAEMQAHADYVRAAFAKDPALRERLKALKGHVMFDPFIEKGSPDVLLTPEGADVATPEGYLRSARASASRMK